MGKQKGPAAGFRGESSCKAVCCAGLAGRQCTQGPHLPGGRPRAGGSRGAQGRAADSCSLLIVYGVLPTLALHMGHSRLMGEPYGKG